MDFAVHHHAQLFVQLFPVPWEPSLGPKALCAQPLNDMAVLGRNHRGGNGCGPMLRRFGLSHLLGNLNAESPNKSTSTAGCRGGNPGVPLNLDESG